MIGYILLFIFVVTTIGWIRKRSEQPKNIHPSKLIKCPACEKMSAIVEVYFDAEEGEKELLHCLDAKCNCRFKNWAGPGLEEERRTKQQKQMIDLGENRAKQQQLKLTSMTNRLTKLNSDIYNTRVEISKAERSLVEIKDPPQKVIKPKEVKAEPIVVTESVPEKYDFPTIEMAENALASLVLPKAPTTFEVMIGKEIDSYDFPDHDDMEGSESGRNEPPTEFVYETINDGDRAALDLLITDLRTKYNKDK